MTNISTCLRNVTLYSSTVIYFKMNIFAVQDRSCDNLDLLKNNAIIMLLEKKKLYEWKTFWLAFHSIAHAQNWLNGDVHSMSTSTICLSVWLHVSLTRCLRMSLIQQQQTTYLGLTTCICSRMLSRMQHTFSLSVHGDAIKLNHRCCALHFCLPSLK